MSLNIFLHNRRFRLCYIETQCGGSSFAGQNQIASLSNSRTLTISQCCSSLKKYTSQIFSSKTFFKITRLSLYDHWLQRIAPQVTLQIQSQINHYSWVGRFLNSPTKCGGSWSKFWSACLIFLIEMMQIFCWNFSTKKPIQSSLWNMLAQIILVIAESTVYVVVFVLQFIHIIQKLYNSSMIAYSIETGYWVVIRYLKLHCDSEYRVYLTDRAALQE